ESIRGSVTMSKRCTLCNTQVKMINTGATLSDATLCNACFDAEELTFREMMKLTSRTMDDVKDRINSDTPKYTATKEIADELFINETDNKIMFSSMTVVDFKDVVAFELLEDDETVTSGGLGRAAAGGAIFGGAGAVVGAVTGKKKEKGTCNSLRIKVKLDIISSSVEYINLIDKKVKKSKKGYKVAIDHAQECLSVLQVITERNK